MVHFLDKMSVAPDPAELAPSRDPAAYGRRPLFGGGVLVGLLLCLVCLAIGVVVGRFGFAPSPSSKPEAAAPEPARRVPSTAPASPAATPVAAQASSATAPSADDTALGDRVRRLEQTEARQGAAAAEALAASALSTAAQGPAPFDRDLAAYERLAPDDPDLRALVPLAVRGAPSRAALAASLPDFAAVAVVASREPAQNAGFLTKLWALIGRVVIVRKVDPAGPGVDGLLARAQAEASAGDLDDASQTLRRLPPAARAPLADWLAAADRRLEIDQRVAAIRARALTALTPTPSATPSVALPAAPS